MKYVLKKDYYNSDGASFTETRCLQFVTLYNFWKSLETEVTYKTLQNEACKVDLFPGTKADSAIRTFLPLFKKYGFVSYDDVVTFSTTGISFALFLDAIECVKYLDFSKENAVVLSYMNSIKECFMRMGLVYFNKENPRHNIWIAIELLRILNKFDSSEYLYALYEHYVNKISMSEISILILNNRNRNADYEFVNEDGNSVADTSYSYIRSMLREAGLITDEKSLFIATSKLSELTNDLILPE